MVKTMQLAGALALATVTFGSERESTITARNVDTGELLERIRTAEDTTSANPIDILGQLMNPELLKEMEPLINHVKEEVEKVVEVLKPTEENIKQYEECVEQAEDGIVTCKEEALERRSTRLQTVVADEVKGLDAEIAQQLTGLKPDEIESATSKEIVDATQKKLEEEVKNAKIAIKQHMQKQLGKETYNQILAQAQNVQNAIEEQGGIEKLLQNAEQNAQKMIQQEGGLPDLKEIQKTLGNYMNKITQNQLKSDTDPKDETL